MQMKISNIAPERIKPNPYRELDTYPILPEKVDALMRSISEGDVGVWPRIIARPCKGGYEMAFGHHLLEAVKRLQIKNVPLIVMDLNDEKMVQYMGRENGEDYGTEFLILLNTWEGAERFLEGGTSPQKLKAVEVASLLGWVYPTSKMTDAGRACSNAMKLIRGGYMTREDFKGLGVVAARELCSHTASNIERVDEIAKDGRSTPRQVENTKRQMGKGAQITAGQIREGKVARKDIRSKVDLNTFDVAAKGQRDPALFKVFCERLGRSLARLVNNDRLADKLRNIEKSLDMISDPRDVDSIDRIYDELHRLAKRADLWADKIKRRKPTVVPMIAKDEPHA